MLNGTSTPVNQVKSAKSKSAETNFKAKPAAKIDWAAMDLRRVSVHETAHLMMAWFASG